MVDSPLETLLAWRQDQLAAGARPDEVPVPEDLDLIATTPGVNRAMLDSLPLRRPDLVLRYAPGVLSTLRAARRLAEQAAAEAPTSPPPTPPAPEPAPAPAEPSPVAARAAIPMPAAPGWEPLRPPEQPAAVHDPVEPAATPPARGTRQSRRRPDEAPAATQAGGPGRPAGPLRTDGFAPFDVAAAGSRDVPSLRLSTDESGSVRVAWEAPGSAGTVLHRVVSRDDFDVWSPDEADLVAVTADAVAHDRRPFQGSARFYAVWAHVGDDEAAARAAQPRLLATGVAVAPPVDVRLQEDHGTVVASWRVARGVHRVDLLRVPADQAHRTGYVQPFKIGEATDRSSYQDVSCTPGEEYEYRLFAVRLDDLTGQEGYSDPVVRRLRVSAMLAPVEEVQLRVRPDGRRTLVDVSWDQPSTGDVVVYRTQAPPVVGAAGRELDVSALPAAGLAEEHRLRVEPEVVAGRGHLQDIAWPDGWARAHFTAVTVSGSAARIGHTATRSRTNRVEDVRLVQRVHWQLLTFTWPEGAVAVAVYQTPPGSTVQDYPTDPVAQLSKADYQRAGGTQLRLPPGGCDVHLVPLSFFDRKQVAGTPTTVSYAGIYLLEYRLVPPPPAPPQGRFSGRAAPPPPPGQRTLEVRGFGVRPPDAAVTLTLVAHRERLPLSVSDTEVSVVDVVRVPLPDEQVVAVRDLDVSGWSGWRLRLFAQAEGLRIAVLDPDVSSLRP